jgi:hypothetical protein
LRNNISTGNDGKVDIWVCIKPRIVCTVKEIIHRRKRQPTDWEKVFANLTLNKRVRSKIHKEHKLLSNKKTNNPIKNGQWTQIDISQKKTCKLLSDI